MTISYQNENNNSISNNSLNFLDLLDSGQYQTYNRQVAHVLGSINAAILLSELINRYQYHRDHEELFEDEWFYYTVEKCEERTCLSKKQQNKAFKILEERGFFSKRAIGIPPKRYFKLNFDAILNFIDFSKSSFKGYQREPMKVTKGNLSHIKNSTKDPENTTTSETPKTKKEPPPKPPNKVVVSSNFEDLKISKRKKDLLQSKYSPSEIETAVKRVLVWDNRRNDEAALEFALQNADSWNDAVKKEHVVEKNREFCNSIEIFDQKRICGYDVMICKTGFEYSKGNSCEFIQIEDMKFIERVKEFFNKIGVDIEYHRKTSQGYST